MARADIKAGAAYVELYAKNSRLIRGLREARQSLSDTGAAMMSVGRQAAMAGGAMALPMALAVRTFAAFDDAMRAVKAVTNATTAELASMTAVAKELGRTTSFTAVEVASLMTELGRAGFKPDQVNAMTGAVLDLARATGTDATLASGIMAASIRQFGLEATDAGRVADGLTAAANKSFNTVEQLGEALTYAGPVAKDFNMSLEDTLAILGGLGNMGIQASSAGTAVRRILTLNGAEAEKMRGIFGVTFMDAAGNARPLVDVLGEVNEATKDLGTAARAQKFNEAFGLLGITGASAIGRTAGDIKQLAADIKSATGGAAKAAAEMDAGIGGSFRKIMSAAEGVQLAIGEALQKAIAKMTDSLTTALGSLTAWIEKNRQLVTAAAAASAGLIATGAALIVVGISLKAAAVGVGVLMVAFKGAVVAAAAFSAITTVVDASIATLAAVMSLAAGTTASNMAAFALFAALQASYPAVAAVVVASVTAISAAFAGNSFAAGVATLAMGAFTAASTAAATAGAAFWAIVTAPAMPFVAAAALVVGVIGGIAAAAALAAVKAIDFSGAMAGISSRIQAVLGTARQLGGVLMSALEMGDYKTAVDAAWIGIKIAFWSGAQVVIDSFKWLFKTGWQLIKDFFSQMLSIAGSTLAAIGRAIANPLNAANEIGTAIGKLAGTTVNFSVQSNADAARAELAALEAQIAGKSSGKAGNDALREEMEAIKEKTKAATASAAEIERARLRGRGLTDPEIDAVMQRQAKAAEEVKSQETTAAGTKAYDEQTAAIELQIKALREGEDAAERARLKQLGLTKTQIDNIAVLKAQAEQLEKVQEISKTRTDSIAEAGDRALARGMSPQDIAKREKEMVQKGVADGSIDKQSAEQFNEESGRRMFERMERLREEARRLNEELRGPQEILNDRLKKIAQLQSTGAISEKTALSAEDKARLEFAEMKKQLDAKKKRANGEAVDGQKASQPKASVATFSARAAVAMAMGGGGSPEQEKLRLAREQANKADITNRKLDRLTTAVKNNGLHHS